MSRDNVCAALGYLPADDLRALMEAQQQPDAEASLSALMHSDMLAAYLQAKTLRRYVCLSLH
jgi:hypothetical protein